MRIVPLVPLALLLSACSASNGSSEQPRPAYEFVLGPDDTDRPITIPRGQRIGVRVTDNPSIGEQWSVAHLPANLRSEGFLYDGDGDRAEGADTTKIFRFVGTSAGRGTLRLRLDYQGERRRQIEYEVITE